MKNLKNLLPKKANEMSIYERATAETPPFFKKLRTIGIVVGVVGGALATAPVSLPAVSTLMEAQSQQPSWALSISTLTNGVDKQ